MTNRYDHRKLPFLKNPRWKKRGENMDIDVEETINFNERRQSKDTGPGLLGAGRNLPKNNTESFTRKSPIPPQKPKKPKRKKQSKRRGTIVIKQSEDEFHQNESRRKFLHSTEYPRQTSRNHFSNILDESGDDEEAIQDIMIHLEEKQKRREQAKYGEDFASIKGRLTELLEDYQESDDEEMDLTKLTDPDFFMSKEAKEKNLAQSEINKLLDEYLEVCHDRTDILSNVYDNLNFEEIVRNLNSPVADDLDNVSSEISMTIEMIQQSSSKLNNLYNRLLALCRERPSNSEAQSVAQTQLRRLDLQKQVINKFKTLHGQNASRKEKVDTWKYAANEIVDLLKSVRNEGANDFGKLEREFEKLLSAFNQQTSLFEDQQDTISKQKASLKKNEAMKEKLKIDNMNLQDDYERTRMLVKSFQMKCAKVEFELKEANEKLEQLQNNIDDDSQEDDKQSSSSSSLTSTSAGLQQEKMQNEIERLENLLKAEEQKNKELTIAKRRLTRICNTAASNYSLSTIEKTSVSSNASNILSIDEMQVSDSLSNVSQILRKKCMKCVSYKSRIEELLKDLDGKRDQIVQLSKYLEDEQQQTNITTEKESLQEIADRYINEDKPIPPNPTPSLTNIPSSVNDDLQEQIEEQASRTVSIVHSSTQQIIVYQKVTLEKEEIVEVPPTVSDQSTQTDFPIIPVIVKQRASVPTQNIIGKNFSSLVDEEFKGMASRIYNFVRTIGEETKHPEVILEETSKEDVADNDYLTPSSSSTLNSMGNSNEEENVPLPAIKQSIDLQVESIVETDDPSSLNMLEQQFQSTKDIQENREQIKDVLNDQNISKESVQRSTDSQSSTTDTGTIKRRGNESGFFDDSASKTTQPKSEEAPNNKNDKSKWESVRSGVINHVLRFINTTAKCRCSYVDKAISDFEPNVEENQTDEDIIKSELNVFAGHAIDMLDIISYSVKQMNESHLVPLNCYNFPVLTKFGDDWKPTKKIQNSFSPRNVTFTETETTSNKTEIHLPDIVKHERVVSPPKPKQQNKVDLSPIEVKAKVAEKKRVKILERHKKLVAKLRMSGVGLKEIYTILGIQSAVEEEPVQLSFPKNTSRKISLIGHGYRPDSLRHDFHPHHSDKLQRMTGLAVNGAGGGARGYSRRLSSVDTEENATMFPMIKQPKSTLKKKPLLFGSNFLQARSVTGNRKFN